MLDNRLAKRRGFRIDFFVDGGAEFGDAVGDCFGCYVDAVCWGVSRDGMVGRAGRKVDGNEGGKIDGKEGLEKRYMWEGNRGGKGEVAREVRTAAHGLLELGVVGLDVVELDDVLEELER